MNEEELATYYEQHKDDPEIWGEPEEGPVSPKQGLGATITVRFTAAEAAAIRDLAKRRAMTYSQLIRSALNDLLQPSVELRVSTTATVVYSEPVDSTTAPSFTYLDPRFAPNQQTGNFAGAH